MGELIIAIGTVVAIAEKIIKKDQRGDFMNPIKILTVAAAVISIVKDLDNFKK